MQKVEGSNPFSRLRESPAPAGVFFGLIWRAGPPNRLGATPGATGRRLDAALIRVEERLADARKTTRYAERRLAHEMAPYRTGFTVNSPSIDAALDALRQ